MHLFHINNRFVLKLSEFLHSTVPHDYVFKVNTLDRHYLTIALASFVGLQRLALLKLKVLLKVNYPFKYNYTVTRTP